MTIDALMYTGDNLLLVQINLMRSIFIYPQADFENRIALTPLNLGALKKWGADVIALKECGLRAGYRDEDFTMAGAQVISSIADGLGRADIILTLHCPSPQDVKKMKKDALIIGLLESDPSFKADSQTCFALERLPRITRAQGMDVLSSQSNLAGYRAVLEACHHYGRMMPMMMTAAGSVKAARLFVIGAGVAGLQALATARRLGAITSAMDVRPAAAEQVESVGARFIAIDDKELKKAEDDKGYAREMSEQIKKKQTQLLKEHIKSQDIVVTTALIPNKPAPQLIDEPMVQSMRHGSVITDLAAATGGNCALTQKDKVIHKHGVTIIGESNLAGRLAYDASFLYGRNITEFITTLLTPTENGITFDETDDIIKATLLH